MKLVVSVKYAVIIICSTMIVEGKHHGLSPRFTNCSSWTVFNSTSNKCTCGDSLGGILKCQNTKKLVKISLERCYCVSNYTTNSSSREVVGNCLYACSSLYSKKRFQISRDVSFTNNGDDSVCGDYKRRGLMCGLCEHNHTPPAYRYNLTCVECTDYKFNWLKYIAIAYLPLTAVYVLVLVAKISATDGLTNGFVTITYN